MDILVNVVNQRLKVATNQKTFVAGTQEFIRFVFELSNDWTNLTTFVQFQQNDKSYNVYLDEESAAHLPPEIVSGTLTIALQGNLRRTIAKSQSLTFAVDVDPIKSDSSGTEITLSLYDQLIGSIEEFEADFCAAEEERVAAENIRVSNETARKNAETARQTAEEERVAAEQARVNEYSELASDIEELYEEIQKHYSSPFIWGVLKHGASSSSSS